MKWLIPILAFALLPAWGQKPPGNPIGIILVTKAPSGNCSPGGPTPDSAVQQVASTGQQWTCQSVNPNTGVGIWSAVAGTGCSVSTASGQILSSTGSGCTSNSNLTTDGNGNTSQTGNENAVNGNFSGAVTAANTVTAVSPVYDVTDATYAGGADKTGVADSTAAINAAISACNASTLGGDVYMPAGKYSVSSINLSHSSVVFFHTCRLKGSGRWNTQIVGNTASVNVLDMLGTNDWMLQDFSVTSNGTEVPSTGLLLARSTTSINANGNIITDVVFQGAFSICGVVSIAAEDTTWTRVTYSNTNATNNYCAFATSEENDFGVSSPNGTIYASSNTANQMIAPEFYEPYPNATPVIFSDGADYTIYGGAIISPNTSGGCMVSYNAINNAFTGPVSWVDTHFEGQVTSGHCLNGNTGTNYFSNINQIGGNMVVFPGASASWNYIGGNDNGSTIHNYLLGSKFTPSAFSTGSGVPIVTESYFSDDIINLCVAGLSGYTDALIQETGFTQFSQFCAPTYSISNAASGYASWTGYGTTAPTGGVFPPGFIQFNIAPSASPAFWTATAGGYVASGAWAATTVYATGVYVTHSSSVYKAVIGGTSASTGPTQTAGTSVDGTVTWLYVAPTSIGAASFASQVQFSAGIFTGTASIYPNGPSTVVNQSGIQAQTGTGGATPAVLNVQSNGAATLFGGFTQLNPTAEVPSTPSGSNCSYLTWWNGTAVESTNVCADSSGDLLLNPYSGQDVISSGPIKAPSFAVGSNPVPITSTTTPTPGAGVCWKTTTALGTCTAGTWPNCSTCN